MDIFEAINQRRAVRRYREREVEASAIHMLLHAAIQAPSTLNQQPWAFGVYHGRNRLRDYSERAKRYLMATFPSTMEPRSRTAELYSHSEHNVFHGAGTLIVIYATPGKLCPAEECYLAAQNILLAACGLGLATCPVGFVRQWLNLPETKRELGVPDHYSAVFPLVVGYAEGETETMPRREPEIVSWQSSQAEVLAIQ
jgi:nitroreductase